MSAPRQGGLYCNLSFPSRIAGSHSVPIRLRKWGLLAAACASRCLPVFWIRYAGCTLRSSPSLGSLCAYQRQADRGDLRDKIGCDLVEGQAVRVKGRYLVSEDNKALVRRWLEEVLTQGTLERAGDLFASNYVLHDPSFPRNVYGPEGVKQYVAVYRFAFPDARFAVEDQIAQGDRVVSRWSARGTHRGEFLGIVPTGEEVTVTGIEFDHVAGGRIEEAWVGYHPFAEPTPDPVLL